MKIAAFQMSATCDPDRRIERIGAAMNEAAENGADLIVAPELALTGYGRGDALRNLAQPADGPWITRLQSMATKLGINVVSGFPERENDACYISAAVINRNASQAPLVYRKCQLYADYEKAVFQTCNPTTVLADIGGLKLGFLICYDVEFPEHTRRLAQAGADAIIVPTALPKGASAFFIAQHVIRVRAFENQVFVVYADHSDADERFEYQGLSCIAAPDGQPLASAPVEGDALIYAELDPEAYADIRKENPYLKDLNTNF